MSYIRENLPYRLPDGIGRVRFHRLSMSIFLKISTWSGLFDCFLLQNSLQIDQKSAIAFSF